MQIAAQLYNNCSCCGFWHNSVSSKNNIWNKINCTQSTHFEILSQLVKKLAEFFWTYFTWYQKEMLAQLENGIS
jgi:hypothetical protein